MNNPESSTAPPHVVIQKLEDALRRAVTTYLETESPDQQTIAALKRQAAEAQKALDLPSIQSALDALDDAESEHLHQKKAKAAAAWQAVAESLDIAVGKLPRRKQKASAKRFSLPEREQLIRRLTAALGNKPNGLTSQEIASALGITARQTKRLLQDSDTKAVLQRQGHARHSRYVLKPRSIP